MLDLIVDLDYCSCLCDTGHIMQMMETLLIVSFRYIKL